MTNKATRYEFHGYIIEKCFDRWIVEKSDGTLLLNHGLGFFATISDAMDTISNYYIPR